MHDTGHSNVLKELVGMPTPTKPGIQYYGMHNSLEMNANLIFIDENDDLQTCPKDIYRYRCPHAGIKILDTVHQILPMGALYLCQSLSQTGTKPAGVAV